MKKGKKSAPNAAVTRLSARASKTAASFGSARAAVSISAGAVGRQLTKW
jgi:hypothetical protein